MTYLSFREALSDQAQGFRTIFGVVSAQIYFTGWQAMPLITVLAIVIGGVVCLQSLAQLTLLGGWGVIGNIMVVVVVRELAPLMVALIVIARSGTAVASEIGNMRVNREIEALEAMGIHPLSYIVFPRIVGGIVSVICLTFYFNAIALLGGFFVTLFVNEMPFAFYMESLAQAMTQEDVWIFLAKNIFSGMIIFTICCYQGLQVKQASFEVPMVTIKAVVNSIIYVVLFNLTVTAMVYLNQLISLGVI
ncbi:ABC transporter permease [Candidatus Kaiserbacteria bacterium]|nr:MAG: ABC transporter permease [Candidatus Kaiserbacteria bacterium]